MISYDEVFRHHNDLVSFVVESTATGIPMPSHVDPDRMTNGVWDTFDHEEGTLWGANVCIFVQDKPTTIHQTPPISDTNIVYGGKQFKQYLACTCQKLQEYITPAVKPDLPEDYKVPEDLF